LYSEIPISGIGDFTVGRLLDTATRVNSNGNIEVVNANIPRLDYYTSGGTAGCPALLVEPQAQNTCLQSETFQSWSFTNASGSSGNVGASPSNTQTAGLFIPNSGTTGRGEVACGTLSNATTYSFSWFIKTPTNSLTSVWLYISDGGTGTGGNRWGVEVNLTNFTLTDYIIGNGSVTSKAVENYGNGWYRVRVTGQVTSGMSGSSVAVVRKVSSGADTNGINGVLVWGAQVETGSVATSYIPTTTGSVTRNADVISLTGVSGLIGQSEGTLYVEVDVRNFISTSRCVIFISDDTTSNSIRMEYQFVGGRHILVCNLVIGGVTIYEKVASIGTDVVNGILKIAFGYKSGNNEVYQNGAVLSGTVTGSGTFVALPNIGKINLGSRQNDMVQFNDRIRAVALYTSRLDDADLMVLTSPTYYSNVRDMIWDTFVARTSTFSELPGCLQTRHNELITL
jgi:hypothetical protein